MQARPTATTELLRFRRNRGMLTQGLFVDHRFRKNEEREGSGTLFHIVVSCGHMFRDSIARGHDDCGFAPQNDVISDI